MTHGLRERLAFGLTATNAHWKAYPSESFLGVGKDHATRLSDKVLIRTALREGK